jgi:hypothetical protein
MPELPVSGWLMRAVVMACLFFAAASGSAHAQLAAEPARLAQGAAIAGQVRAGEPALYRVLALKGDRVELAVASSGPIEIALFSPDGARLGRQQGQAAASITLDAGSDGIYVASVFGARDARFTLQMKRVATGRPTLDPAQWGVYTRLVGASVTGPPHSGMSFAWSLAADGGIVQDRGPVWGQQYIHAAGPGRLTLDTGKGDFDEGTIEADGSVVWQRKHGEAFRLSLEDGVLKLEQGRRYHGGSFEPTIHWVLQGTIPASRQ